jgi:hypothetical protein
MRGKVKMGSHKRKKDPSVNVMELVKAAVARIDDLREATLAFTTAEILHLKEVGDLRAKHALQLGVLETSRLNAIRQVDVLAVSTAADRAAAQALVLASQVNTSAETLRSLVASTATSMAQAQAQFVTQVTDRLALVEKTQYETKGKDTGTGASWTVVAVVASLLIAFAAMFATVYIARTTPAPAVTVK